MKEERKDTVTTILPAILLAMLLIALDLMVHVTAPNPQAETALDKGRKIAVYTEAPEQKSKNEIQYEKLLLKEQALLEEIRLLQENTDSASIRKNKPRADGLEDELYRIQISKHVLEARMEAEKLQWTD